MTASVCYFSPNFACFITSDRMTIVGFVSIYSRTKTGLSTCTELAAMLKKRGFGVNTRGVAQKGQRSG